MEKLTENNIKEHLNDLPGWEFKKDKIQKTYKFEDFKTTFSIMTRIAFEVEKQNHHPDWTNVYNSLEVCLNTHEVGGVTEKDIKLAKTIETIINT